MDKKVKKWEIAEVIFVIILGTLLHFVYKWSGYSNAVAIISTINESVWEHLKLVLYPVLIFTLIEYLFSGLKFNNLWPAKAAFILSSMCLIVIIFYTYTFFTGKNLLVVDILTYIISIIVGEIISSYILNITKLPDLIQAVSKIVICALIIIFSIFTFYPPKFPIFKNPEDGTYGINI